MHPLRLIPAVAALTLLLAAAPAPRVRAQEAATGPEPPWIINDGGVPNLPAGSLTAIAMALERGAPAVWLDLVLSGDNQVVLLGDTAIGEITTVGAIYPERSRPDGSFLVFDFSLNELRQLSHRPAPRAVPTGLHPTPFKPHFPVVSLGDVLGFIDLAYRGSDDAPTLICTLRHGWRHQQEGLDLGAAVLKTLDAYQSESAGARFFLASYDPEELQRLALTRGAAQQQEIEFIQLVGSNDGRDVRRLEFGSYEPYNYDLLFSRVGIKLVSTYATVVGLDAPAIIDSAGSVLHPRLLEDIEALGMESICSRIDESPYTPAGGREQLFEHLLFTVGFDGLVTRQDEQVRTWLSKRAAGPVTRQQQTIERLIDQIEGSGIEPPGFFQPDSTR